MKRETRFRILCHILSALLLVVALWQLVGPAVIVTDPMLVGSRVQCTPECTVERDPVRLLTDEYWKLAWRTPNIDALIAQRLEQPAVQGLLIATALLRAIPLFLLFISLAIAVRGFAVRGVSRREVRWLRRAAFASILWTLAQPVSDSLQRRAMNAVVRGSEESSFLLDPERLLSGLLIAGVALVAIRIIEGALALRDDLEDYV